MKITDVQACVVGRSEPASGGSVWTFVRVYTDEGIVGTGECNSAGAFSGFAVKETILAMRPLMVGRDPRDMRPLISDLRVRGRYGGAMEPPIIFAITGVENALYDILGKSLGVPVYRLLGGRYRDSIRLYADCHAGDTDEPAAYAEKAQAVVEEGFTALKFDADSMGRDKRQDRYNRTVPAGQMTQILDTLCAVRDAIGFGVDLGVDCHGQFDMPSAVTLGGAVDGLRLMWIEEPLPAHNTDALVQVRSKIRTPICTGENHYTLTQFRDLLQKGAVDILMPDLAKAGGIAESMQIAALAETYYVPIAPHNVSSPLGMAAACHVLASIPNFLILEFHARDVTWWDDLCQGGPFVVDGAMAVPERPGLGVELDDDVARELLWNGDEYFKE